MQEIKQYITPDKEYLSDSVITRDEWFDILMAVPDDRMKQIDTLLMFFRAAGHCSSCSAIEKEYSIRSSAVNRMIISFNQFAKKFVGNRFRIESADSNDEVFWPISMTGRSTKSAFEWTVRPELCLAIEDYLRHVMIERYRKTILAEGLDNTTFEELYKWKVIASCQGKSTEDILGIILSPACNFIEKAHMGATALELFKSDPASVCMVFDLLRQDKPLRQRISEFRDAAKTITPEGKTSFGDERTAAAFLSCINPYDYTPYTSTMYEDYCKYIGVKPMAAGQKYEHFLSLLAPIKDMEMKDVELIAKLRSETEGLLWSDTLNAQDVLWQMSCFFRDSMPKNWIQKMYNQAIHDNHWVYSSWYPEYKKSIKLFEGMFAEGVTAESIPDSTKDYFIRATENYISSNPQGTYTYDEYGKILNDWPDIYAILKECHTKKDVTKKDNQRLRDIISKHTKKDRKAALHRIWAGILPEHLTTVISDWRFNSIYDRIRAMDTSLPAPKRNWLEDNKTLMAYFDNKVVFNEPLHKALFAWYLFEELKTTETDPIMERYIKLLENNHNLILTGAPGTGKTYLAKEIAKALGATEENGTVKMVQFHPSYDYTDFVEGLRPRTDSDGFERIDGVFKKFCAKAVSSVKASNFDEAYEKLFADLMTIDEPLKLTSAGGGTFAISANSRHNLNLHTGKDLKINGSLLKSQIEAQLGGENVYKWWAGYFKGVESLLINKYGLTLSSKKAPENYVFIIDEINRGELSKIFGELFFSIDPGYRGTKGRVETQYQNLVEAGDPFEDGFYVPENVYIIGTMNDIDRGVESMDFAIRRRFAWAEVTADSRKDMLQELIPEEADKAIISMDELNKAISDKERGGLTSAYHIGPAYYTKLANYEGKLEEQFECLWEYHIKGLLFEYLRGTRGIEDKIKVLKEAFDKYKA